MSVGNECVTKKENIDEEEGKKSEWKMAGGMKG